MDVLITTMPEKIPPEIRQLQEPDRPLPANVQFFEEKFTGAGLAKRLGLGLGLETVGIILIAFFLYVVLFPNPVTVYSGATTADYAIAGTGLVFIFAGYFLLGSLWPEYRLMQQQRKGADTRYGIFLVDDMLVSHNWFDTTIIPRPFFKGLAGGAVRYELKGEAKSFDLPDAFIGSDRDRVEQAIVKWAASSR